MMDARVNPLYLNIGNPYMTTTGLVLPQSETINTKLLGIPETQEELTELLKKDLKVQKKLSFRNEIESKVKNSLTSDNIGNALGKGADMLSGFIGGDKAGYNGKYGSIQRMGDQAFDTASSAVMAVNPLIGGIMKAGGLVSDVLTKYAGMGTDSMTKTDALLGSKLLSLSPAGMINGFFGKKTQDFSINQNTLEQVGGSYGGSVDTINQADAKSNKKYGLFSSGSRRKANRYIDEAKRQQNLMTNIADEAMDQRALAGNDLNYINYNVNMSGGYDQRYMRAAKHGMKLQDKIDFIKSKNLLKTVINLDNKTIEWKPTLDKIPEFQEGGLLKAPWEPIIDDIQEFQEGGKIRTLEELIAYAKEQNPRFIQRMSEPLRYVKINFRNNEGEDEWNHATHMMNFTDNIVYPMVQEDPRGQLFIFEDSDKALAWAELNGNVLRFNSPEEAENFAKNYKQGWKEFFDKSPIDINPDSEYEEYEKNKFKLLDLYSKVRPKEQYKEGGSLKSSEEKPNEETSQKNVIPEGALHKNKHHMEHAEGLTKKGIPVIDEDGDQQAEIELNEIIFTLEVTKKLEELYKKYYSEEHSQKEKDEFAINAGKLLVKEILFNTDDKTGLISKCQKGGQLNGV